MTINHPRSGDACQILPHVVRMIEKRVMDQITFFPPVDKCAFTYWEHSGQLHCGTTTNLFIKVHISPFIQSQIQTVINYQIKNIIFIIVPII